MNASCVLRTTTNDTKKLGVNDGLVSTFLLVAGVVGGGFGTTAVLLTAISGGIAGAVSMAAGEFIATKSQDEVLRGEIALEDTHIRNYHKDEMKELGDLLHKIGLDRKKSRGDDDGDESSLTSRIIRHYEQDDEALLKVMIALEFGVIEEERRSPFLAGAVSFGLFLCGALFSIVPFSIVDTPTIGLVASAIATAIGLLLVGCFKTWATRGKWYRAAMENLFIAAGGGALAYGIGAGFEHAMRK